MKNGYLITKGVGLAKKFFTIEDGRRVWTNNQSLALRFADKKSAQMLIDADHIIPGKDRGTPEPC